MASVPSYAASVGPPIISVGGACKLPGASCSDVFTNGYVFEVSVTNTTNETIWLYNQPGYMIVVTDDSPDIDLFFQAAVNGVTGLVVTFPAELTPGASVTVILNAGSNGDAGNIADIQGTISVPWGNTPGPTDPVPPPAVAGFTAPGTPPIQSPDCSITLPPNCGTQPG
ncbi:hypothetical protein ARHIZOSPH14_27780 [Agromyces rhizosphaerae]|uniref:Uncharacterized protein n=1 Tax=Agromyces rhizosphaerae TaxID=88374 RepID=A0A9W6CYW6_9MICO|nr:hypothetical protein [Agromyces rhizosphaerae]GLI28536.1 hypothetical protein ARHIZOSPH14_27780 [Agromyces rhizosphaerae]